MSRVLTVFSWIVLVAFAALVVWTTWCLLYPYENEILTTKPGSWTVQNAGKRVRRGQKVLVLLDYCVDRNETPRVDTLIEQDGRLIILEPQFPEIGDADVGCHRTIVPLVTIPRSLPIESTFGAGDGKARIKVTLRYYPNPLREVQYYFTTEDFIIDP